MTISSSNRSDVSTSRPSTANPAPGRQTDSTPFTAPRGSDVSASGSSTTPSVHSHVSEVVIRHQQRAHIIANILQMSLKDQSAVIGAMEGADAADLLQQMNDPPQASRILTKLGESRLDSILDKMDSGDQVMKIARHIKLEKAPLNDQVEMIESMENSDAAKLLQQLNDPPRAGRILAKLGGIQKSAILEEIDSLYQLATILGYIDFEKVSLNDQVEMIESMKDTDAAKSLQQLNDPPQAGRILAELGKVDSSRPNTILYEMDDSSQVAEIFDVITNGHQPGPGLRDTIDDPMPEGRATSLSGSIGQNAPAIANLLGLTAHELTSVGASAASDDDGGIHESARGDRWKALNDTVEASSDGASPRLDLPDAGGPTRR